MRSQFLCGLKSQASIGADNDSGLAVEPHIWRKRPRLYRQLTVEEASKSAHDEYE
jgi:hypothetical protein